MPDSRSGRSLVSIPNHCNLPSPARRGSRSRPPLRRPRLAIRKAPSASVESIQPRPPQPCEVGRPKGGRREKRRNLTTFFSTCRSNKDGLPVEAVGGKPPGRRGRAGLPRRASVRLRKGTKSPDTAAARQVATGPLTPGQPTSKTGLAPGTY